MRKRNLIPLTSPDQVPKDMTESEAREFWPSQEITEEYLASTTSVPEDALPPIDPPRKYQAVHLKREVFEKVRRLARERGMRVDDLIDMLATEALAAHDQNVRITGS